MYGSSYLNLTASAPGPRRGHGSGGRGGRSRGRSHLSLSHLAAARSKTVGGREARRGWSRRGLTEHFRSHRPGDPLRPHPCPLPLPPCPLYRPRPDPLLGGGGGGGHPRPTHPPRRSHDDGTDDAGDDDHLPRNYYYHPYPYLKKRLPRRCRPPPTPLRPLHPLPRPPSGGGKTPSGRWNQTNWSPGNAGAGLARPCMYRRDRRAPPSTFIASRPGTLLGGGGGRDGTTLPLPRGPQPDPGGGEVGASDPTPGSRSAPPPSSPLGGQR